MTEEAEWLLAWFGRRGALAGSLDDQLGLNYFDAHLIDSLGVIELIRDVEERFGVQFHERHFQDRRFPIVRGLGEMVAELRRG